jgi:signal peptidase I
MKEMLKETFKFALIALLIVLPIRTFIAQPFLVHGESMIPTFKNGDYLIVDELSYRFNDPRRGDVIILKYPINPKKYFIKRIVGLPNETVYISGSTITIENNEGKKELNEEFIKYEGKNEMTVKLKANEYFVMGDNRSASSDSRIWGPLTRDGIVGKAFLRLWPPNAIDYKPGEITYE